jgi:hypothetical protein
MDIWGKNEDGSYVMKKDVESQIRNAIDKYPELKLSDIAKEIRVTGSMGTTQWTEDSDLDVHIIPDLDKLEQMTAESSSAAANIQKDIKRWNRDNKEDESMHIGKHKMEIFLQLNPAQEYVGDTIYNLDTHEWQKGPTKVGQEFNPYEEYKGIIDTISSVAGDADKTIGELKRDVIDYDTIKQAISRMPEDIKEKLKLALADKLKEIEADIEELMKDKKEWIDKRKGSSSPATPEQALQDVDYVKRWKDENITFKFLNRYQYMRLINDMEDMKVEGGGIDDQEVKDIGKMLGVFGMKGNNG